MPVSPSTPLSPGTKLKLSMAIGKTFNIDLKPCPFDAGRAELDAFHSRKFPYRVVCSTCWIATPGFKTVELAEAHWNRRV